MFASQLLRILQALPTHLNHETCAFDTAESTMKENQNGVSPHLNGRGWDADSLASEMNNKDDIWNTSEIKCSIVVDDFTSCNENEVKDSVAPCTIPTELFQKGTDLYSDKNVMECELPELIVCYKESTYHVVKDICIDEGLPSENKILIENVKEDHKGLRASLHSNGNKQSDMTIEGVDSKFLIQDGLKCSSRKDWEVGKANECGNKDKVDVDLQIHDELKSSSEDDIDQNASYKSGPGELKSSSESDSELDEYSKCGPGDLLKKDEENCNATDRIMDVASREEFVSNSVLSVDKLSEQTSLKSLLESSNHGCNGIGQLYDQISCVEAIPEHPVLVPAAEESNKSHPMNNLIYDSKVESGTITFNFDSCKPAARTGDRSPENVCEQTLESLIVPIHDGISANLPVASQFQRGGGESSFSLAEPVSGRITYSGPIAYSGSNSLRSDSSAATSTRSFAFPVLQSEWNSSPVRMAKADGRHFRRHRGWRHGLLCCRF